MNENGILSFLTEIPSYFNIEFPLDYPIIAVFYSDVDCRGGSGSIWYRVDKNPELLQKAKKQVQESFMNSNFEPVELFIATWDQVGYFEERSNKVNVASEFKCRTAIINIKARNGFSESAALILLSSISGQYISSCYCE